MEIKIAICDDDLGISAQLETMLREISENNVAEFLIDCYQTGEGLCDGLDKTEYDLIFLDIEMPRMNGVRVGNYIREEKRNDLVQIAYISANQQYAMELFHVRPIDFLLKPMKLEKVESVINTYLRINGVQREVFRYIVNHQSHKIEIQKIIYFQRCGRKVIIHTKDKEIEYYDSLENIYEKLKEYRFLFIHKSYMVNSIYIQKMAYDHVLLTNDKELPISQSRRKAIRTMYMEMEG